MVLLRSFLPPRATGAARATFKLFSGTGFNGVGALSASLTINSITVTPSFRYKGGDATATELPAWDYGNTLPIASTGTAPSLNQGSPCLGDDDDSVQFNNGKFYQDGSMTIGNIGTNDVVIEALIKTPTIPNDSNQSPMAKRNAAGPNEGWNLFWNAAGDVFQLTIDTGASAVTVGSPVLDLDTWYHVIIFVNRDEASTNGSGVYANAVKGTGVNMSATSGDADADASGLIIGGAETGIAGKSKMVTAYLAMWQFADWHQAGASGPTEWITIAQERFARTSGFFPIVSKGSTSPTTTVRASIACVDKLEDSNTTRKLYQVGDSWARMCSRLDSNSDEVQGFLAETVAENKCLQSEDLDTTWTKIDAGDTIGGSLTTPDKTTSTTAGIIGDATDGPHGVEQAVTVTAATWTFSTFAKQGDQTHLLLGNSTIANDLAYFNLSTGAIGTVESGVTAAMEDWGDGWYRCSITFTGTAAAHSLQVRAAEADNDLGFAGDGATVNVYAWGSQAELGEYMTSYVPTTTTALTRNADTLRYSATDNIKDAGKGHLEVTVLKETVDTDSDSYITNFSDGGAAADQISLYERSDDDATKLETRATSGNQGDALGYSDLSDGTKHALIASWQSDRVGIAVDNIHEGGDNSASVPDALDRISVGMDANKVGQFNGLISGFTLFAKSLLKGAIGENFMAHLGCTYISSSAGEAVVAGTFEKVAGTYTAGTLLVDFTESAGVLTYTGTETKTFIVFAEITCASGASNPLFRARIAKNGTSVAESEIARKMGTAADRGAMGLAWCIELATSDTLELQYTDDASSTLTAHLATLMAISV